MINGYVLAGYSLIWASLLLFAWRTKRRLRNLRRELDAAGHQVDPKDGTRAMTGDSERMIR